MAGWNGSGASKAVEPPKVTQSGGISPSIVKGIAAGLVVVAAALAIGYFVLSGDKTAPKAAEKPQTTKKTEAASVKKSTGEESRKDKIRRIQAEMNEQVKPFIKASPTNNVRLVNPPLDPNDPDNALRTQIARDIATLVAIRPGEEFPECIPFDFMFEDDAIAARAARGEKVVTTDGGNKKFLDDLKKWKVTIKEGDSEAAIATKSALADAQLELLKGMDEGISVNDSIRAAYEFRVRAAEKRRTIIDGLKEMHTEDPDVETTRAVIKKMNAELEEAGIIPISEETVIPDADLERADAEQSNGQQDK